MAPAKAAYTFRIPKTKRKSTIEVEHPEFAIEIRKLINDSLPIHNKKEYTKFIKRVTRIISKHREELTIPNPIFKVEMENLPKDELNLVIPAWGGVAPKVVDVKNEIRMKYLIVKQALSPSGVLGPEYHILKDEHLTILEGFVILIGSEPEAWKNGQVTMTFAGPGDTCTLHPGNRHGIIALTNTVIQEDANNTLIKDILPALT